MKKIIAIILTLVIALSFAACGKTAVSATDGAAAPTNRLEEIKACGYIEMCTEPYFAPYEFIDATKTGDEQYVGLDIELGKYIAEKLGVELKIVPLEFSAVLAGIADGKYDMAISALAYSPARAETMSLSDTYYSDDSSYGFLMREEDAGKYESIESLKNAVIVTQSGSVQEAMTNEQITERKELKIVSAMTDGFLMVSEGKADVCVCERASAQLYADANGGLAVSEFSLTVDENMNGTCVALPVGEVELTEFVNQCISELKTGNKITEWYSVYSEYAKSLGVEG